jgi:hypothetical protein
MHESWEECTNPEPHFINDAALTKTRMSMTSKKDTVILVEMCQI